ncbi:cadherin repeat domain-containing protein [Myroides injenensis]|uniref:hypothetical protein n=1 Tax=Myroides injenensis TaxID=1183151 RepID=UPI00226DFC0C|nr:hypothetical protein [Myroides injenensis]
MRQKMLYRKIITLIFVFFTSFMMLGQVQNKVDFKLRKSAQAPGKFKNTDIYRLQGDFTMIGNANLFNTPYSDGGSNSNDNTLQFYKLKGDSGSIKNSSSADLELPEGMSKECTEIVYAGLYWSGRGDNDKMILSNNLAKNKIKIKLPGQSNYEELTSSEIHFGKSDVSEMYTGYIDITEKVRNLKENAWGTYAIADIATTEGNGGSVGYYGGWGIVVIYSNPTMKWKDITVFDGFSQIAYNGDCRKKGQVWIGNRWVWGCTDKVTTFGELEVSGFRASQSGDVKIKMGMMAGEGDRGIEGDVFDILKKTPNRPSDSDWYHLSHSGNKVNNFFNSSILTGGNTRVPNRINNFGMDVVMFDLPNSNNQIIENNQTSTKFRFGTVQDTYVIFNIVFAVDAYVPEIIGENKATDYGGVKPLNNGKITPGQEFEFELDVYNKGTEAVNNSKIEIPVPFNLHYSSSTITGGLSAYGNVKWNPPVGGTNDPSVTAGGTIVWEIGNLPLDTTKEKLLAQLKYRFKVSDNCILLSTNVCRLEVKINGKISGVGATSKSQVNSDLVRDYGNGVCAGPVYDDFISTINVTADFLQNCNPPVEDGIMKFKAFCSVPSTGYNRSDIVEMYPVGAKFYSKQPTTYTSDDGLIRGDFPVNSDGSGKLYYVMVPGMEDGCYAKLEISVDKVTTSPTVNDVTFCFGETIVLENELSNIGKEQNYSLVYFDSNQNEMQNIPNPSTVGTHKYFVAEGKEGCLGPKKEFIIVINALPEVSKNIENIVLCENFDSQTISITTNTSNYKWEYSATESGAWNELNNETFSNVIILGEKSIKVNHATKVLDGLRIRVNVTNDKCSDTSNEFEIKVNDCSAVTNPMLLNQGISN